MPYLNRFICGTAQRTRVRIFVLCAVSCAYACFAELRLHPDNPHYFIDTVTGRAVLLASHGCTAPTSRNIDYKAEIRNNKREKTPYVRVWHWLPWQGAEAIWPWSQSESGDPAHRLYDFTAWNPDYWNRLRDDLDRCNKAGIYAELILFEACGMKQAETRWRNNPWASDNNVNQLELPVRAEQGVPDFYNWEKKPNVRREQERYLSKMLDETARFPCILYELENEHFPGRDAEWTEHYAHFVKEYLRQHFSDSPRLLAHTGEPDVGFGCPDIDIVNFHSDSMEVKQYNHFLEGNWKRGKAMNVDELANGETDYDALRRVCWTIVASGGHFHIEDARSEAKPYEIVRNINRFVAESKWDFVHAAPNKNLVDNGQAFVMANSGIEYICYVPAGGTFAIHIAQGTYAVHWWNPRDGGFKRVRKQHMLDNSLRFQTPDANDWVAQIRRIN